MGEVEVSDLRKATNEFTGLIDERLPLMFESGEAWPAVAHGFLARTGRLMEALTLVVEKDMAGEGQMLLRILYEHVTTFCWIAIEPDSHVQRWMQWTDSRQLKVHNDAKKFGVNVLNDDEVAKFEEAERPLSTVAMAEAVDRYWPDNSPAFRSVKKPEDGFPSILTFTGFYTSVYRKTSNLVHADLVSVDRFMTLPLSNQAIAHAREKHTHSADYPAFSVALTGFLLIVFGIRFDWPPEEWTRGIVDGILRQPSEPS